MAIQVLIATVDRTPLVRLEEGVSFSRALYERGTCQFQVYDPEGEYLPAVGNEVSWYEDGVRVFFGSIDEVAPVKRNADVVYHTCYCTTLEARLDHRLIRPMPVPGRPVTVFRSSASTVDVAGTAVSWVSGDQFTADLVGDTVNIGGPYIVASVESPTALTLETDAGTRTGASFINTKRAGRIIRYLLANYAGDEYISAGSIEDGAEVPKVVYNCATLGDAIRDLAERSNFVWYIDDEGALHFQPRTATVAPIELTDSSDNYQTFTKRSTREDYANAVLIRYGFAAVPAREETVDADGVRSQWVLNYPIDRLDEVRINSQEESFGIEGSDTEKTWYYRPGENVLLRDAAAPILPPETWIAIKYRPLGGDVVDEHDPAAIAERQTVEGSGGRYEILIEDPQNDDLDSALAKAAGVLAQRKRIAEVVQFRTRAKGLRPGQLLPVTITRPATTGNWLIRSVNASLIGQEYFWYQVEAINDAKLDRPAQFFGGGGGASTGINFQGGGTGLSRRQLQKWVIGFAGGAAAHVGEDVHDWPLVIPCTGTLVGCKITAKQPPTGADLIVDLRYQSVSGGTPASIFGSTKLVLPDSSLASGRQAVFTSTPFPVMEDDRLILDCLQVGSSDPGSAVLITLYLVAN